MLLTINAGAADLPAYSPVALPGSTHAHYDKLADVSVVEMRPDFLFKDAGRTSLYGDMKLSASFQCPRDTIVAPDSVSLMIVHGARVRVGVGADAADWWFPEAGTHVLRALVDDVRMDLGTMVYRRGPAAAAYLEERGLKREPGLNTMPELVAITLPAELIVKIFGANTAEAMVDGVRVCLLNKAGGNWERYRDFAGYLTALKALAR